MVSELLILPQNIVDNVCGFLDNRSLLQLRQTCKLAKERVDMSILKDKEDKLTFAVSRGKWEFETKISFECYCGGKLSLWRIGLISVLHKLNIHTFQTKGNAFQSLTITLTSDELKLFLEYLKPIIHKEKICSFEIAYDQQEIFGICSNFLEGNFIHRAQFTFLIVNINSTKDDYEQCLRLIGKAEIKEVLCHFPVEFSKDSIQFLLKLGDMVKRISIYSMKVQTKINILHIIREIISRKCEILHLQSNVHCITQAEAEELIQFCHHLEKRKFHIAVDTSADRIRTPVQFGVVNIKTIQLNGRHIVISRFDIPKE